MKQGREVGGAFDSRGNSEAFALLTTTAAKQAQTRSRSGSLREKTYSFSRKATHTYVRDHTERARAKERVW